ncbi:hypothetical protein [Leptolyngbya sp. FACHB-17]|uniref:hypothetical protein n=1 Tax=unclassified Leptolyngbya TaxID=2650499 RepID=UPI001680976C|nr:hypothetical protein [Leptolyngbya sp. FACHB-17]MBD2078363.1 hypothetical protein [Leptolyngbya sp. FACHB-17]
MTSKQSTEDFVPKRIAEAGTVSVLRMFGEFGSDRDEQLNTLTYENQFLVKHIPIGRKFLSERFKTRYESALAAYAIQQENSKLLPLAFNVVSPIRFDQKHREGRSQYLGT